MARLIGCVAFITGGASGIGALRPLASLRPRVPPSCRLIVTGRRFTSRKSGFRKQRKAECSPSTPTCPMPGRSSWP